MSDWITHFERIKQIGFNWVFINPFHYPGFSGSLYAVKDYYKINPLFIDKKNNLSEFEQLQKVVKEAHKKNIYLLMDLVINHTAIDSDLTITNKNWYKLTEKGEIKNPGCKDGEKYVIWGDLAEIDNENSIDKENLWEYWDKLISFYLKIGFDGFRCDAAYQVPSSLWKFLINNAKKENNNCKFFAESLGCEFDKVLELCKSGFDYIFNSSKWWDFEQPWCLKQYSQTYKITQSISFPESHDTERVAKEYNNINVSKMKYAFASFFSTGVMMPIGYEYGFTKRLNVVTTTPSDWEAINFDITDFIKKINSIKLSNKIFREESPIEVINLNQKNIFCYKKTSFDNTQQAIIAINKDFENKVEVDFNLPHFEYIIIENEIQNIFQPAELKLFIRNL